MKSRYSATAYHREGFRKIETAQRGGSTGRHRAPSLRWLAAISAVLSIALALGAATAHSPRAVFICIGTIVGILVAYAILRGPVRDRSPISTVLASLIITIANCFGGLFSIPLGSYLPLIFIICITVLASPRIGDYATLPTIISWILVAFGIIGTLIGRIVFGTSAGAFPLLIPMTILLVPIFFFDRSTSANTTSRFSTASVLASVLMLLIGLSYSYPELGLSITILNHEKSMITVLAVGFALASGSRLSLLVAISCAGYSFVVYPGGTFLLVMFGAAMTYCLVRRARSTSTLTIATAAFSIAVLVAAFSITKLLGSTDSYFTFVGKSDNSSTRRRIYNAVFDSVDDRFFSDLFTRELSVRVPISGQYTDLPAHSDILTLYKGGGLFASMCFILIFASTTVYVGRTKLKLSNDRYNFAVVTICTANGALLAGLVNPVLLNPSTSAIVFAMLAASIATASSAQEDVVCRKSSSQTKAAESSRRWPTEGKGVTV